MIKIFLIIWTGKSVNQLVFHLTCQEKTCTLYEYLLNLQWNLDSWSEIISNYFIVTSINSLLAYLDFLFCCFITPLLFSFLLNFISESVCGWAVNVSIIVLITIRPRRSLWSLPLLLLPPYVLLWVYLLLTTYPFSLPVSLLLLLEVYFFSIILVYMGKIKCERYYFLQP